VSQENPRVFIQTFGCQMNDQDSGTMLRLLEHEGYAGTAQAEHADVILINTCSVREKPESKVRSLLGRYRPLKEANPDLVLGVTGCYAQTAQGKLLSDFPFLDLVMGPDGITRLPGLLLDIQLKGQRVLATEQLDRQDYPFANELVFRDGRQVTAFVNIQKGCDNLCSFCIVPFTRGREVSRPAADVVAEVQRLAESGVREVTLLGQNVNSYGLKRSDEPPFHELVAQVSAVDGIERVRFTTSNPWDLDPGLIEQFASNDTLCSYFHLPVQAGSDSMLQRMRRRHTVDEYLELVGRLKDARPDIALSTDIIVGFPGETEAEHEGTLRLLEAVQYDFIYSFRYSPRPHTQAVRKYADDVSLADKKRRLTEVQALQKRITEQRMKAWEGQVAPVLVEGPSKKDATWLSGRISQNWIVNFPAPVRMIGQTVDVTIERAFSNSMAGSVVTRGAALPVLG
jgi:tRNA-2-methylthio-N6-dimethylallyladenosine synthase